MDDPAAAPDLFARPAVGVTRKGASPTVGRKPGETRRQAANAVRCAVILDHESHHRGAAVAPSRNPFHQPGNANPLIRPSSESHQPGTATPTLRRMAKAWEGGTVRQEFLPEGLQCRISLPLGSVPSTPWYPASNPGLPRFARVGWAWWRRSKGTLSVPV